jgi:hypothetical protein
MQSFNIKRGRKIIDTVFYNDMSYTSKAAHGALNTKESIMATFNGHKNWNHWNVSMWINNDEGLYRLAQACITGNNRKEAAELMLKFLPEKTPDGAPYSVTTIKAAMREM